MLKVNFPTFLTLLRLVVSPIIMPLVYAYYLRLDNIYINFWLALIFVAISITDFLDGYLARALKQETLLGKLLDPIADKFLLYSTLIVLVEVHRLYFFWAIILIGREFFVMGLREVGASYGINLNVSVLAKYKTAAQMIFLTCAILNISQFLQSILLFISIFLSLTSAVQYYLFFSRKIKQT